jgi:spoIIIJ-associated protein
MERIKKSGKTVEEALRYALARLGVDRDEVEYNVLQEPSNGILGIIGTKEAIIEVFKVDKAEKKATNFLSKMLKKMNIEHALETNREDENLYIEISGEDMALVIGRRGQTLDALQYLTSLVVNKDRNDYVRILLDAENYREKRKKTLQDLAIKLAKKARRKKTDVVLEPMNPYERRIIHSTLQNFNGVKTNSKGKEPYRKVVIEFIN